MVSLRKNSPFTFLIIVLLFMLQPSSCNKATPTSATMPGPQKSGDESSPSSDEGGVVELPETKFAESPFRHKPFFCIPPDKSYLHKDLETDIYYDEGWEYTIQFNFDENRFTIAHDAATERHYPEKCYSIYRWHGEGDGSILEEHLFEGTMSLNLELTRGCEEVGDSPATEETVHEVYEWWIIGKIVTENIQEVDEKTGTGTSKWIYALATCTCNSNAYQYSQEERDRFYQENICPPCVPGGMICELVLDD